MTGPFAALGLRADAGLTDDDVRAAWRRVAAATHPDRADGGDPAAFAEAAAAYALLRTRAGRGEALADVREQADNPVSGGPVPGLSRRLQRRAAGACGRIAQGRPWRLALRALAVVAVGWAAIVAVGWQPASAAVITGALTWLARSAQSDLGPRRPGSS